MGHGNQSGNEFATTANGIHSRPSDNGEHSVTKEILVDSTSLEAEALLRGRDIRAAEDDQR